MGLLTLLGFSSPKKNIDKEFKIDLERLTLGSSKIGEILNDSDLLKGEELNVEIGKKNGVFDYFYLVVKDYGGAFTQNGKAIFENESITPELVKILFKEPYHEDKSDGEIILFYIYEKGTTELQFEFSDSKTLSHITLLKNGILSDPEQRKSYGVTKPYPED